MTAYYKNLYNETNGLSMTLNMLTGLMDGAFNGTANMSSCRLEAIRFSHNITYFSKAASFNRNVDLLTFYSTSMIK